MLGRLSFVALAALLGSSCADPRCSPQNCKTMIQSCRVEPYGGSTISCGAYQRPTGYAYEEICVKACNELGVGPLVECVAKRATECETAIAAKRYQDIDAITAACAQGARPDPQQSCADSCEATRTSCNEACYPSACDRCVRSGGGTCMASCPESTYEKCMGCSSDCNIRHAKCVDACPR